MSSHSQTTSGPSSDGISLPPDPTPIFELNQARRAKIAAELESLRSGKCRNRIFAKSTHRRIRSSSSDAFPTAFLEWPTVEGLEAFVEKKVEYNEMMEDMIEFFRTATHEHRVYAEAKRRAAKLAEERRLQEFQRALEGMNPAEAEAALQAERERALRLQKEREARAAALDAKVGRARARYLEKYPLDN
jgi:hypothetical protein